MRVTAWPLVGSLVAMLAGCSSSLNNNGELTPGLPTALTTPAPQRPVGPTTTEQRTITGFRGPMIIVFSAQDSHDGERIPTVTLNLPLKARQLPGSPERLEIMTVYGPRWVATSEVVIQAASGL
jgi:hypothetical protein